MKRYLFPLILGLVGVTILLELGFWQLRRLAWKEAMIAEITASIDGPAQDLPGPGTATKPLKYTPVQIVGATTGEEILVLTGEKDVGAGYEVISAFETGEGRRLLLDRGFIAEEAKTAPRPATAMIVTGNLHWPEERDSFTPDPDAKTGIWFARDVPAMAAALKTEPILVVARQIEGDAQGVETRPLGLEGIRNDHLQYAITWFSLALVWLGMTGLLLWRVRRRTAGA
ncbi:MAG: SURF1 family protein [Paenirhodobacter sp.]|uniref:SURF1 family protein n=1 Tax=Paenirhodobacter sp. TaxID=1965326 RepID=UPI003D0BCB1D